MVAAADVGWGGFICFVARYFLAVVLLVDWLWVFGSCY